MKTKATIKEDFKEYEKKWISKEGYICYVVFLDKRHRCGYVRVDKNNITNNILDYNDVPVNIHGGLTFGSEGIWGFDCAHSGDTLEKWTLKKVEREVNNLSKQLAKLIWEDIIRAKMEYMPDWFKLSFISKQALAKKIKDLDVVPITQKKWMGGDDWKMINVKLISLNQVLEILASEDNSSKSEGGTAGACNPVPSDIKLGLEDSNGK